MLDFAQRVVAATWAGFASNVVCDLRIHDSAKRVVAAAALFSPQTSTFGTHEASRGDFGACWAKMGPTWVPRRVQNGAQEGAKREQKRRRQLRRKKVRLSEA